MGYSFHNAHKTLTFAYYVQPYVQEKWLDVD